MIEIAVDKAKEFLVLVIDGDPEADRTSVLPVPLSGSGDGVGLHISPSSIDTVDRLLQHSFSQFPNKPWTLVVRPYAVTQRLTAIESEIYHPLTSYRTNNDRSYVEYAIQLDARFPEEARTACEQYLLYFVQFLKDVGVEATAELQRQASQVLFTVTPQSQDEALDKIRSALDVYLTIPIGNFTGDEANIATQRLASNVYHLRSQLALAQAVIEAKDATIQAHQATLTQQQHLLRGSVVVDSLVKTSTSGQDSEAVLDGLAEITKYEGKGFNINLPEVFRRLRELFAKD